MLPVLDAGSMLMPTVNSFRHQLERNMNCPTCNVPLLTTERQAVEIDYCPDCHGIWLDRGEFNKITQGSAAAETKWYQFINDDDAVSAKLVLRKHTKRLSWRFVHYWTIKSKTLRSVA
jgi:Zn-finger nucleic acid-binding protein